MWSPTEIIQFVHSTEHVSNIIWVIDYINMHIFCRYDIINYLHGVSQSQFALGKPLGLELPQLPFVDLAFVPEA